MHDNGGSASPKQCGRPPTWPWWALIVLIGAVMAVSWPILESALLEDSGRWFTRILPLCALLSLSSAVVVGAMKARGMRTKKALLIVAAQVVIVWGLYCALWSAAIIYTREDSLSKAIAAVLMIVGGGTGTVMGVWFVQEFFMLNSRAKRERG